MRIYLDDSVDDDNYIIALRAIKFEVISPREVNMRSKDDLEHLQIATRLKAALLTSDEDYQLHHENFLKQGTSHAGIFFIHRSNNKKKDMKPYEIAKAIKNIIDLKLELENNLYHLNEFKY